jgi:regulatory protein
VNELRRRAIALLARREHGRAELATKLAPHGTEEDIATLLAQLESEGLLSDARAAAAYVRAHGQRLGAARLRHDLRRRGLDPALAEGELADLDSEAARARGVLARKFPSPPANPRDWARQARFLQGRGFSVEVIRRVVGRDDPE